jgi:hypothetical protein
MLAVAVHESSAGNQVIEVHAVLLPVKYFVKR